MVQLEQLEPDEGPRLRAIRLRALLDAPDAFGSTFKETADRPAESWSQQLLDLPTFVAVMNGLDVGVVRCARRRGWDPGRRRHQLGVVQRRGPTASGCCRSQRTRDRALRAEGLRAER